MQLLHSFVKAYIPDIIIGMKPTLILICGLPGSGKTTLSKTLAAEIPVVCLRPDDWLRDLGIDLFDSEIRDRLETRFWKLAQELLVLGQSVVLESGFWSRSERDEKRLWARSNGIAVELHFLDVSIDELLSRVQSRHDNSGVHEAHITREHLEEWSGTFQAPDEAESSLFDPRTKAD